MDTGSHILVIGASKGIGREVVREALARGHLVRAFARSADAIGIEAPKLETRNGDALDPEAVRDAVEGVDAVVIALGIPKTVRALLRPTRLFSAATEAIISAMKDAGVRRLIAVTGFGAGESYAKLSSVEKAGFKSVMGRAYADKDRQEELIRTSGLDWTIARPGFLNSNRGTGRYQVLVDPSEWRNGMISRADVAHFIVGALEDGSHVGAAPVLVR